MKTTLYQKKAAAVVKRDLFQVDRNVPWHCRGRFRIEFGWDLL
jgi:hypothetical protein